MKYNSISKLVLRLKLILAKGFASLDEISL